MRILIATDGSEFSRVAAEKCCQIIADPKNTSVKIVSVFQKVVPLDTFPTSVEYAEKLEQQARKEAEEYVAQAAAIIDGCFPNSKIDVTTEAVIGAFNQRLVEEAKEWKADLMVVGSHGRGFWGRVMLGSVSDSLVHHAPCSVLVVRTEKTESTS